MKRLFLIEMPDGAGTCGPKLCLGPRGNGGCSRKMLRVDEVFVAEDGSLVEVVDEKNLKARIESLDGYIRKYESWIVIAAESRGVAIRKLESQQESRRQLQD